MSELSSRIAPPLRTEIFAALRWVYDPVYGLDPIEMGMVLNVRIAEDGQIVLDLVIPYADAEMREQLLRRVISVLSLVPDFHGGAIQLHDPLDWDTSQLSPHARQSLGLEP